jgi:ribose-phosphate pyrophosphokinase
MEKRESGIVKRLETLSLSSGKISMILGFPDSRTQAQALGEVLSIPYCEIELHCFPDGESKLTLPEIDRDPVFLFRTLDHPNHKLVEVFLAGRALRERGVKRLSLVAPYLCYMRQDFAFQPGEVVSQRIVGSMLAELFDDIITVDPHLHRISRLEEAVPAKNPVTVSAAPLFARYLAERCEEALLMGPDLESEQWVGAIARAAGLEYAIATKTRFGDRDVSVAPPALEVRGRSVVLIDDIASTGCTLAAAARQLQSLGAAQIDVLVTHPLFVDQAMNRLTRCGVRTIGSSDSIVHATNLVHLAPVLAEALRMILEAPD